MRKTSAVLFWGWLLLSSILAASVRAQSRTAEHRFSYSVFPILMYDSDVGLGYGGRGVVKNLYRRDESFDLVLFNSTKGEQYYVFAFSVPDAELRQGKEYPLALDFRVEYDKMIHSNFFGFGNATADNEFQFIKESGKLEITLSHAFSARVIAELGYRFTGYSTYGFDPAWGTITPETPGAGESRVSLLTARLRWDTRDSQINPQRGFRAFYAVEYSPPALGGDWDFVKHRLELSAYRRFFPRHILAARLWLQGVNGPAPYTELSKIGDSETARGYKADRFMDSAMILGTVEYRFPLYRRLGGVLFLDAGRVAGSLRKLSPADWHRNWGWGLRYYLANFVVRMDVGISAEGQRLFFNFNHVF